MPELFNILTLMVVLFNGFSIAVVDQFPFSAVITPVAVAQLVIAVAIRVAVCHVPTHRRPVLEVKSLTSPPQVK